MQGFSKALGYTTHNIKLSAQSNRKKFVRLAEEIKTKLW